jgi:epoxyqueuosine reductase
MTLKEKSERIKELASAVGFDDCGIAQAHQLTPETQNLQNWLINGFHAEMHYMQNHFEKRLDPTKLVEGAKSIIVVLLNYFPKQYPFENKKYKIARYALGKDYHFVVKEKLQKLLKDINEQIGNVNGRAFVDSAPVLERAWALEAGLGWIGQNSLLLSKKLGSYVFIGELLVDIELAYDTPQLNEYCGTCRKCIEACPTKAIIANKIVDSNKCISYQTIENKGEITLEISEQLKGRIFGCDICQEVCPFNKRSTQHNTIEFNPSQNLSDISDSELENISEEKFQQLFYKSPVKRAKYKGLKRNIAACNNKLLHNNHDS